VRHPPCYTPHNKVYLLIMKKMKSLGFLAIMILLVAVSCASQGKTHGKAPGKTSKNVEVIRRGAGTQLGTVYATAAVTEDRAKGTISGDTGKYGLVENIPISRVTTGKKPPKSEATQKYEVPADAAEKAYANAVYELIQQVKAKGGNAVTEVVSEVIRNYDPETRIETVQVKVSAEAILLPK